MNPSQKRRVAVLFGGRSGEHEVSLRSAASVIRNLPAEKFEVFPVGIDHNGRWFKVDRSVVFKDEKQSELKIPANSQPVVLLPYPDAEGRTVFQELTPSGAQVTVDVVFPVLHGTFCEDGTLQGVLDLAEAAYVGCGVLASAVGMDKEVAKRLALDAGIPIVPFICLHTGDWKKRVAEVQARIDQEWGYPVFVKPVNAGSSLGVHKVKSLDQLLSALKDAFRYDRKVLIEKGIPAREIEISGLENIDPSGEPLMSTAGEIVPKHEFYSYEAKYLDENGAELLIPARLDSAQVAECQALGRKIFRALEVEGMARIDFFLDRETGKFYLNEINTLPGFTSISMYPKLWEASGLSYSKLLEQLIDLAQARQTTRRSLLRKFEGV